MVNNPLKPYGEDALYNFITSMVQESKYCGEVMKNILTENS